MFNIIWLLLFTTSSLCEYEHVFTTYVNNTALMDLFPEDAKLNLTGLATKYGYDVEEHEVITEDGYIITIFRIGKRTGKPLLMMHGVIDSSDTWFLRGKKSIGFLFANAGWDLWVGNVRGNKYGRKHMTLEPDRHPLFWDYSYHDFGYYDTAATVDYILNTTGEQNLRVVGHSQGTTIYYVLCSLRPEYNDKIKILISLAPVAFLHNAGGTMITPAVALAPLISGVLNLLGQHEVLGDNTILKVLFQFVCYHYPDFCAEGLMYPFTGVNRQQIEHSFYRKIGRYPSATSRKNLVHLAQTRSSKRFAQYDYGPERNLELYGSTKVPDYDISKVTMKVALICSVNDGLSSLKDVELLRQGLSNVVEYYVLKNNKWNHADYLWGRGIPKYLLPKVFQILDKHQ